MTVGLLGDEANQPHQSEISVFLDRYYDHPDLWAEECIDWPADRRLIGYQAEALRCLVANKRHALRGPRGLGKTTIASLILLWFATTRSLKRVDWKCISTANYWRQLEKFLWPEVHKWTRRVKWGSRVPRPAPKANHEILTLSLRLAYGAAFPVASDDPESMEGAHADEILYLFDESKIIPSASWDSVEGALSNTHALWFASSIPGETSGRLYDICRHAPGYEDWSTQHVSPDEVIAAGQMLREWADQRRRAWGEDSALYRNHVLGEFSETTSDSLIPLAWVEAAQERWQATQAVWRASPIIQFGVDVGRGGDKSVIAPRTQSGAITELIRNNVADTMHTAGLLSGRLAAAPAAQAMIDLPGVGAGVVDKVREEYPARTIPFIPSAKTEFRDRSGAFGFLNKRQAALWNLRELLDPDNGEEICLPPDDVLSGDLTSYRFRYVSGAKIKVESKRTSFEENEQTLVERLGHSPDDGDAVVMAFWTEPKPQGKARRVILG